MNKIIVYVKDGCPYCEKIRIHLKEKGLPFEEREVTKYSKEFQELRENHNAQTVPTSVVNGKVIIGSDKVEEIANEYKNS